jgi:hypothetical protein
MTRVVGRIRRPVRRGGVERYLLLTLLSFAGSVGATRLFLELAGYPQLGTSELHIAHVLWGGLLLFVAALLPLIYANRWVYDAGAVLAGVGVGLFIDEVGKFITQSNDYFFPAAAPIVYAFFLLTVLLYYRVRRPVADDPREQLYRALEAMEEVLDHDLDRRERAELDASLARIASAGQYRELAEALRRFLNSSELRLAPRRLGRLERWGRAAFAWEARWITADRHRALLAGGLVALGAVSLGRSLRLMLGGGSAARVYAKLSELALGGRLGSDRQLSLFQAQLALEAAVGTLLVAGALLLVLRRDRMGIGSAYAGLLLSLTMVNLLVFYFEQFSTIVTALVQFTLLVAVLRYRSRFLTPRPVVVPLASPARTPSPPPGSGPSTGSRRE